METVKVPMSLDAKRSGYGWEMLATFVRRARHVQWDDPDIALVLFDALSADHNHFIETLQQHTDDETIIDEVNPLSFESFNEFKKEDGFTRKELQLMRYFVQSALSFKHRSDEYPLDPKVSDFLSREQLIELLQFQEEGFGLTNNNSLENNDLASYIKSTWTVMDYLIHVIDNRLMKLIMPSFTKTDIQYVIKQFRALKGDDEFIPEDFLLDEKLHEDYITMVEELGLKRVYGLFRSDIHESEKYSVTTPPKVYDTYGMMWYAFQEKMNKKCLTDIQIFTFWVSGDYTNN